MVAQTTLQSQNADSLYNADQGMWAKVVGGVIGLVSLILENHDDLYLIDRVTIVRGFAELSVMYPNNPEYRQRLTTALLALSETLSARDDSMSAAQVKSLSDRCRKFGESTSKADNGLTLRLYSRPPELAAR